MLRVPHTIQQTSYTCGPAAVQSVLRYYRQPIDSERQTARDIGATPKDGSRAGQLAVYLRQRGIKVRISWRTSISQICRAKGPVIVLYQKPGRSLGWKDGHWAVVVGCTGTHVVLVDSSSPRRRVHLKRETFEKRWYDMNGQQPRYRVALFCRK